MKFYKKNPAIDHDVTVQGKKMGAKSVVCGDEFAPFADPNTFVGWIPRLIEVSFEELTDDQRLDARMVAEELANRPPRHLGVITSDNISHPEGKFKVSTAVDISKVERLNRSRQVPEQSDLRGPEKPELPKDDKDMVTEEDISSTFDGALPRLSDMYTIDSLSETFPGVTSKNASSILTEFLTLESLQGASNAELRKVGIRANFFDRLRRKAGFEKIAFEKKR